MASFELKMPKLGESVAEGTIGRWLKAPGEAVAKYEPVVEVQTDKVNAEIPSPAAGVLREIKVVEGTTVPVGALLALLETAEASVPPSPPAPPSAAGPAPVAAMAPPAAAPLATPPAPAPAAPAVRPDLGDVRATPAVRRLAQEHGVDISQLGGSGLGGRVTKQDVETFVASRSAAPAAPAVSGLAPLASRPGLPQALGGDQMVPLTQMRRAIAQNMTRAWSAPHAHAVMEVDMTAVSRFRAKVGPEFVRREGFELSPAAFIVKAAVEALRAVPLANASWTEEGIVLRHEINVGYAVSLGEDGLVVPVIRGADEKSLTGLMRAIRDLVDRAKARRLTFDDFAGGTFTVNNTGPLGTVVSSPIIVPGQAAIVSSESIIKRVVVTVDDQLAIRHMMNLVIGFDHRVVDGSTAARVLASMRGWLEGITDGIPVS